MNKLIVRSISGIILVAIIVVSLWCNYYTRFTILALIGLYGCWEFLSIYKSKGISVSRSFCMLAALALLSTFFFEIPVGIIVALFFITRATFELYRSNTKPLESISYELLALVYTVLPMALMTQFELTGIFAVMIFVWINDVGAYIVGSTIGKRRLFPRLSPKKSWEGFWGGLVFAVIGGYAFFFITETQNAYYWMIIAAFISLSAVVGDLFESMMKRSVDIKDSGNVIPGHGGILDRFDAMFFAAFVYYIVDYIIKLV